MVHGYPPGKSGWNVAIARPERRDRPALTLELRSGSLSTSSSSEQPGHILDPRTRMPVEFNGSVIAWHERGLVADILSTALFVMGPEKGLVWANARGLAACFLIPAREGLTIRPTRTFAKLFSIEEKS
jgi:thiamine biosynthesis lipoprotein